MPRPRQLSKIQVPPRIKGFIPHGYYTEEDEPVLLNLEEYESIRLLDYEHLSQLEAASFMDVSRPTLTRIYDRARKKVAIALTEAREILIEGGKAIFEGEWHECRKCNSRFNNPGHAKRTSCIICEGSDIERIKEYL